MSGEKKVKWFFVVVFYYFEIKKNLNYKILVKVIGVLCRELL